MEKSQCIYTFLLEILCARQRGDNLNPLRVSVLSSMPRRVPSAPVLKDVIKKNKKRKINNVWQRAQVNAILWYYIIILASMSAAEAQKTLCVFERIVSTFLLSYLLAVWPSLTRNNKNSKLQKKKRIFPFLFCRLLFVSFYVNLIFLTAWTGKIHFYLFIYLFIVLLYLFLF